MAPMSSITPFSYPPPEDFIITIAQTGNGTYTVTLPYGPSYGFEDLKRCMEFVTEVFAGRKVG